MKRLAFASIILLALCAWTQAAVVTGQTFTGDKRLNSGDEYVACTFVRGKVSADGNVTVRNSKFDNSSLYVKGANNRAIDNEFWGGLDGAYFNNRPMIFAEGVSDLLVKGNLFRDGKYAFIGFHHERLRIEGNTYRNVYQGAHVLAPKKDCYIGHNRATGLTRMFFEVQRHGDSVSENLLVENNVATDWQRPPINDSFGLSIVADRGLNTVVRNNYLVAPERDSHRAGMGIEFGALTGSVTGNVIAGNFVDHIVISGAGGAHNQPILVEGNKFFGKPAGYGNDGGGKYIAEEAGDPIVVDRNNVADSNYANRPPVPGTTPTPPPTTQPPQPPTTVPVFIEDPVVEVTVKQRSGKITVTKP